MTRTPVRRVLVVEDEVIVAMMLEDMIAQLGYTVVGPFANLHDATPAAEHDAIDVAILDVNLGGDPSFPIADALAKRGIPFVFATGYGAKGLADRYRDVTTLKKPFSEEELERALTIARS